MPLWCNTCNRSIALPHVHDNSKEAQTLRRQNKIKALRHQYTKSLDEYREFLNMAIDLCEEYNLCLHEIEKIVGHKI